MCDAGIDTKTGKTFTPRLYTMSSTRKGDQEDVRVAVFQAHVGMLTSCVHL
jgi:hypothetical protein